MTTPEPITDVTQAENSVSGELAKIVARLNRLPAKAGREGESPSVWKAFGECVRDIEGLVERVVELEEELTDTAFIVAAVFSPDPTASWDELKRKLGLQDDPAA